MAPIQQLSSPHQFIVKLPGSGLCARCKKRLYLHKLYSARFHFKPRTMRRESSSFANDAASNPNSANAKIFPYIRYKTADQTLLMQHL